MNVCERRGAGSAARQRLGGMAVLLAVFISASGCLGPAAINYTRTRYNNVYRDTNHEQLLLNIVRLRRTIPVNGRQRYQ